MRARLTFANVVSVIALFVALGGSSYAAVKLSANSVRSKHIKNGQVRSVDVKDSGLRARDFAPGQLPQGARGDAGPRGEAGAKGDKGDAGPGAEAISYVADTEFYGDVNENALPAGALDTVAAVGPWTVKVLCYRTNDFDQARVALYVSGDGVAEWIGGVSSNDGEPFMATGGVNLSPSSDQRVGRGAIAGSGYSRTAFDVQLRSGSAAATLSFNGVADWTADTCTVGGTIVPGS